MRPLEGWELLEDPAAGQMLRFARRCYRHPGAKPVREEAGVNASALPPTLRRALATFVLLGTVDPADAGAIAAEASAEAREGRAERDRPAAEAGSAPGVLARGFARLHPRLPAALDDPMRGVLTTPLHESLFSAGCGLLPACERLLALGLDDGEDPLLAYARFYVRCRRTVLHLGLALARSLPALTPRLGGSDDFFAWWRTRQTQRTRIDPARSGSLSLGFPPELQASKAAAVTGVVANLAREHERLATRLGRASSATRDFIAAFAVELLDGTANLLLNGREGSRCPRADQIAVALVRPHRYSTRAQVVKTIELEGTPFEDCFGRFFAAAETRLRLPRSGREIAVRRLGTCPFPDCGFVAAAEES
ncbi:MAG TPA: hypothetical protein VGS57_09620 [Thermoanaerobaculia bacterium]|nr:hypothetical protein [Thermoanaerobaculia bacterium]